MSTVYIGSTKNNPRLASTDIVGAASGGTLSGGQVIQIVYDDASFPATPLGKEMLMSAVQQLYNRLQALKAWPLTSSL
jgi:hypothetical protein